MDAYEFWRWIHVILFVLWLGADVGVFICGSWVRRESLSVEQRTVLLQASAAIDLWPRFSAALMLPVGLMLARTWNPALGAGWIAAAWAVAITWLGLTLLGMRHMGTPLGATLSRATHAGLVALSIACFAGGYAWLQAAPEGLGAWLAAKLTLYGVVALLAIGIEVAFGPVIKGFPLLSNDAERQRGNELIRAGMNRTLVVVATLYAVLLIASILGVAKPF
ncbi:MAG: hypothetical protein RIS35_1515 [Pseudomonadota bacterium]|jgi:hypothetical protein